MSARDYVSGHAPCPSCEFCERCGEVAFCLSQPGTRPCAHDRILCGEVECLSDCIECVGNFSEAIAAEMRMYQSGEWSGEADPFYRPERKAEDDKPRNLPSFDPITNSYRREQ